MSGQHRSATAELTIGGISVPISNVQFSYEKEPTKDVMDVCLARYRVPKTEFQVTLEVKAHDLITAHFERILTRLFRQTSLLWFLTHPERSAL